MVRNLCSCVEIKDCKRDQGVRRGKELPRVFARRSGTVKAMKNSCEEVLAKRSRIAKTSRLVKGSILRSTKELVLAKRFSQKDQ